MSTVKKLSVVIPTYNCGEQLEKALRSVAWADEIIIVDMGSSDQTVPVAKKFKSKIFTRIPSSGNFDENRKLAMRKASGDWVLKLDSDEILSFKLQQEIKNFLKTDNESVNGVYFYNRIFMLGKQIRYGFVKPNSHELRMFRRGFWSYDPYRFHQQVTVKGKTRFFDGYYDHFNVDSISDFITKMNRYTDFDSGKLSKKISVGILDVCLSPVKTFIKLFFWQLGFLDGSVGFIVCSLYSVYSFTEKAKIWQKLHDL